VAVCSVGGRVFHGWLCVPWVAVCSMGGRVFHGWPCVPWVAVCSMGGRVFNKMSTMLVFKQESLAEAKC